jgi:acyl dehydratase
MTTFEDCPVGRRATTAAVTVTETHVVMWSSLTGDWYPLHTDEVYARGTHFGGRVVHGPFTFALAVGLVERSGFYGDSILAWLGCERLRAVLPVRVGDTLSVEVEVTEARESSEPDRGVARIHYSVRNQRAEVVMEFDFMMLLRRAEAPNR